MSLAGCDQPTFAGVTGGSSEDITGHKKERYSPIIITVALVCLIFVLGNDFGVPHFVWYFMLSPAMHAAAVEEHLYFPLKNSAGIPSLPGAFSFDSAVNSSESSSSVGSSSCILAERGQDCFHTWMFRKILSSSAPSLFGAVQPDLLSVHHPKFSVSPAV